MFAETGSRRMLICIPSFTPDDRKPGKGAKESKQFHENCNFNLDHTK